MNSDLVVAHYDQTLPTSLIVDASPEGLGAILTQEQPDGKLKPVYYASRALTVQEKKYCQTEREALAVVWGCERFHLYLFGVKFTIFTDHQPLTVIYSPKGKPSPRILRWGLRLQSYSFDMVHIPGSINPADMLSIHPIPVDKGAELESNETELFINAIVTYAISKALSLSEIITESQADETLKKVQQSIATNIWSGNNVQVKPYIKIKNELTSKGGIILRENRIIIPSSLRERTLKLAHECHMGIVKTKAMMRDKVWWPGIDADIDDLIKNCIPCISMNDKSNVVPMQFTDLPMSKPWHKTLIDICGPFPTGENILGIIDASSRWPDLHIIRSTSSETIKNCLEKTFSTHGYPLQIVTDNAPNLTSAEVSEYCSVYGIDHHKATPYWPQGNSEIERFYRTLSKFIKTTNAEGRNWRSEINKFLLTYRNTPHCTTNVSPAMILMSRKLRDKIPSVEEASELWEKAAQTSDAKKIQSKLYYDQHRHTKPSQLSVGDYVLTKQKRENKLSTPYNTEPGQVTGIKGPAITVRRDDKEVTRNVADIKKIPNYIPSDCVVIQMLQLISRWCYRGDLPE